MSDRQKGEPMQTIDERRTLTLSEAAKLLGIGRSTAYEQARTGSVVGVPVLRVGRRQLLSRAAIERVLDGEDEREGAP
jgi:excisionase family DNA binding protein